MGKREHCGFVGFERDLLGEHHIASYQGSFGNETPPDLRLHFFIKLQNIAHGALMNSIRGEVAGAREGRRRSEVERLPAAADVGLSRTEIYEVHTDVPIAISGGACTCRCTIRDFSPDGVGICLNGIRALGG